MTRASASVTLLLCSLFNHLSAQTPRTPDPPGWRMTWHDEFDGAALDATKWSIGLPWKGDDGTNRHHNSQYASVITDEDVKVEDGHLRRSP